MLRDASTKLVIVNSDTKDVLSTWVGSCLDFNKALDRRKSDINDTKLAVEVKLEDLA